MQNTGLRVAVAIFFVALVATPVVIKRFHLSPSAPKTETADAATAAARYGMHLEEVSKASGIDFVHKGPTLDPRLGHIMPQIASMGAAVSVCDFDRDGWNDIYVTNSGEDSANCLFHNKRDGSFEDVAAQLGVADLNRRDTGVSMGSVWGDYDNDGFEDLFVYKWGRPELFHNDGGKGFTRVTDKAGFPAWVNANSGIWLDYDRDGKLDLFLAGYYPENVNLWHLANTKMMPESFEYAKNGGRKYLLHNKGDGTFEDTTAAMGIDTHRWALAVAAADLRGTGYPDIFIANDYGVSELFANDGGKRFVDMGEKAGVGFAPKSGMNVSFGDVLNQGRFGIYVSNITEEGILVQGNNFWMPVEGTSGDGTKYENLANAMGVEIGGWSFGAQFGDLNNDGHMDLYLVNGYVSADKSNNYWYDYSKITGGNSAIISDAANWPAMDGRSLGGYQQKRVWLNDGASSFREVAQGVGATDTYDGRSVVLADLWNRGVLDVVVANQRGPLLVYKNTAAPDNGWVDFELEGAVSNRSAIGAQVRVFFDGGQQVQEVSGGVGFCAQNQRRLHFGLGKSPNVEKVEIRWPSGKIQELQGLQLNTLHKIQEPS